MKYLKKFESRSKLDIQEVLDVFKDFADEFVAKYRDFEQLGDRSLDGLFYSYVKLFDGYEITIEHRYESSNKEEIKLHCQKIRDYVDSTILPRLKEMGIECYATPHPDSAKVLKDRTRNVYDAGYKFYFTVMVKDR